MDPLSGLALLLVVVGWGVVNSQHNKRESRKEARAAADRAKVLISGVARASADYMAKPDPTKANAIKLDLELAELELEVFPNFKVKGNPLMGRLVEFQDAVTGGDFESGTAKEKLPDSPEAARVRITLTALMAEIEKQFRAYFK